MSICLVGLWHCKLGLRWAVVEGVLRMILRDSTGGNERGGTRMPLETDR